MTTMWALLLGLAAAHPPADDPVMEACNGEPSVTARVSMQSSGELMVVSSHGGVAGGPFLRHRHPPPDRWVRRGTPRLRAQLLDGPRGQPTGTRAVTILDRATAPHRAQLLLRVEGLPEGFDSFVWLQRKTIPGWRRTRYGPWRPFRPRLGVVWRMTPAPSGTRPLEPIRSGHPPRPGVVACSFNQRTYPFWSGISVRTVPTWARAAVVTFDSPTTPETVERAFYAVDFERGFRLYTPLHCDGWQPAVVYPSDGVVDIQFIDGTGRRSPAHSIVVQDLQSCGQVRGGMSSDVLPWRCAQPHSFRIHESEPVTSRIG